MQKLSSGKSLVSSFIACCWCGYSINANIKMSMHKCTLHCADWKQQCCATTGRKSASECLADNNNNVVQDETIFCECVFIRFANTWECVPHFWLPKCKQFKWFYCVYVQLKMLKRENKMHRKTNFQCLHMPSSYRFFSSRFFSRVCVHMYLPAFYLQSLNNAKSE